MKNFLNHHLQPADYVKMLINTKNADGNKENVKDIEYRISDLKDRIKKNEWKIKKRSKCGWDIRDYSNNSWFQ